MEAAPFFVDLHHLRTFVAIYILSRFTHFFRKSFLCQNSHLRNKSPFLDVCLPPPLPLSPFCVETLPKETFFATFPKRSIAFRDCSMLNASHSLFLTILPHPPPPDRAQTVSCLDASPTISHKRQQILIPPQTWSTFHDTSITSTIV